MCRVLVQELEIEVDKTSSIKSSVWLTNRLDGEDNIDERKGKKITYKKSYIFLFLLFWELPADYLPAINFHLYYSEIYSYWLLLGSKSSWHKHVDETFLHSIIFETFSIPRSDISCTISYEVNDLLTSISFYLNFLVIHSNDYIYTYALFHREMRLMDILEYVCKNVYNYRSIAGPEFPYLKGGK